MAANRRRSGGFPAADLMIDDRSRGNDNIFDDDENPFESLGRALDHCKEIGVVMAGAQDQERTSEYYDDRSLQLPDEGPPTGHELSIGGNNDDSIVDNSSMAALHTQDNKREYRHQKENRCDHSHSQMHGLHESTTANEIRPQVETSINNQSNTPIRNNNLTTQLCQVSKQRKVSPHRFTFQTSTKPKSTSFKTPSRSSLPTDDLFSSSAMSQRVIANRSTRKSISNESSQKRNQRHTFRNSMDRSNTPTVDNNVREMRFVPTFLSNARVGTDNTHEDTPREKNDDDDTDSPHDEIYPFTHNMVSNHHRQQQQLNQSHRKSEQATSKAGYLVQRLRSLRNSDQRMAMQLRSGQNSTSGLNCATMPRKRRRSSGDYLDPRNAASTIMDVTVSGASQSICSFDEGKTVLLAYIHCYTTTKQPSDHSDDQFDTPRLKYPCFALILMSRDAVQEQGIVGSRSKQLRIYDGVVVPPRVAALNSDWNDVSYEAKPDIKFHSEDMPTIIRTQLCEEYPTFVPLPEVTFPQSSSSKM